MVASNQRQSPSLQIDWSQIDQSSIYLSSHNKKYIRQNLMNIEAKDDCKTKFEELKFRKIEARYIVYKIEDQKIVIDRLGERAENWEKFIEALPEKEYRYCVFDFEFTNEDKMAISKMIFVNWSPDGAPIKNKILYATAKESFKKYLDLNTKDHTLNSRADMTEADMIKELSH